MAARRIVLIRHGRSSHAGERLLDHAAFLQWREAYEAAGIDPADAPSAELCALAQYAGSSAGTQRRRKKSARARPHNG